MVKFGNIEVSDLRLGSVQPKAVYFGDELVWNAVDPVSTVFALKFTSDADGSGFQVEGVGSPSNPPALEYSTDGGSTWSAYTIGNAVQLDSGKTAFLRASQLNSTFSTSDSAYYRLATTGSLRLDGFLNSLHDPDGQDGALANWFFDKFLGNSGGLSVNLDLSGVTSLGQGALSGFAHGVQFGSGSTIRGFDGISALGQGAMLSAFAGSNIECEDVMLSNLRSCQAYSGNSAFKGCQGIKRAVVGAPDAQLCALPSGAEGADALAMFGSSGIEELSVRAASIGETSNTNYITTGWLANGSANLRKVSIEADTIGCFEFRYAFQNCTSLSSAEIKGLSSNKGGDRIFFEGFGNCTSL